MYIEAIGRNQGEEYQHSHYYYIDKNGEYTPMCIYGWNRSDGFRFSIFRGRSGSRGLCKICDKRAEKGLLGVESKYHRTKWL